MSCWATECLSNAASLESAKGLVDLLNGSFDPTEANGVAVGQVVHGAEGNVEAAGAINGKNIDGLVIVGEFPARAALQRKVNSVR